ncbi:MAG: hypothetical protein ACRES9_05365 [Gammaproteobacteria bacterium]
MKSILAPLAALPFVLFALATNAVAAEASAAASQNFAATVPAAGLKKVKLDVSVGAAKITTGDTNAVKVRVRAERGNNAHFIFKWTSGNESANGLPADLHLVTRREGATLVLCLASAQEHNCAAAARSATSAQHAASSSSNSVVVTPFGSFDNNGNHHGWKTDWTLVIPARLALRLKLGVGDATVSGIAGGLDAEIGVGHLDARLPQGPAKANVGVGHIEAAIGSSDYGPVDLSAGVGHVGFEVNGEEISKGVQKHFTSASQKVSGTGKTAYTLESGVGHVELKLGVKSLSKPMNPKPAPVMTTAPVAATHAQ